MAGNIRDLESDRGYFFFPATTVFIGDNLYESLALEQFINRHFRTEVVFTFKPLIDLLTEHLAQHH